MQKLKISAPDIRLEAFRQHKKEIEHGICIHVWYVIKALSFQAKGNIHALRHRVFGLKRRN
jgi:hypothetical protein